MGPSKPLFFITYPICDIISNRKRLREASGHWFWSSVDFIQQDEEAEILARLRVVEMATMRVQGTGRTCWIHCPRNIRAERILSEFAYKYSHLTQVQGSRGWLLALSIGLPVSE